MLPVSGWTAIDVGENVISEEGELFTLFQAHGP
jgi:hypothetical protein